jgi:predicted amidohydrolase YtcJ
MLAILAFLALAPADAVVENARIWTDGYPGFVEFAAIRDGKFIYVGPERKEFVGPKTTRLDAEGRVVLPGLFDCHIHMLSGGLAASRLYLRDAASKESFITQVKEWAQRLPEGQWVLGGRWSVESWAKPETPSKSWVDPVTGDRPLFLVRMDGHSGLANSAALRLAGITRNTPNPAGGVIDKDDDGEPTGILRDEAMGLMAKHIPPPTVAEKVLALKRAMAEANAAGLTSVNDIPNIADLPAYEALAKEPDLPVRLFLYPVASDWSEAVKAAASFKGKAGWVEIKGLKGFADGSLGSRTAYMREPYSDNPEASKGWRGLPMPGLEDGGLAKGFAAARKAGLQAIVHAIGDEANHQLLKLYMNAGAEGWRPRSEHAQHLLPEDISAFAKVGAIASMQPLHKADDGRYAEERLGVERCKSSYAFKSLLDSAAVVAFGSDWPVVSLNPFLGIEAAVTGRVMPNPGESAKVWMPQENITVGEALRCYTSRAAYACFMERELGRVAPGYRADFIVLNRSPFAPDVKWGEVRPIEVWVGGKRVRHEP